MGWCVGCEVLVTGKSNGTGLQKRKARDQPGYRPAKIRVSGRCNARGSCAYEQVETRRRGRDGSERTCAGSVLFPRLTFFRTKYTSESTSTSSTRIFAIRFGSMARVLLVYADGIQLIEKAARERFNEGAAAVMRAVLKATESTQTGLTEERSGRVLPLLVVHTLTLTSQTPSPSATSSSTSPKTQTSHPASPSPPPKPPSLPAQNTTSISSPAPTTPRPQAAPLLSFPTARRSKRSSG